MTKPSIILLDTIDDRRETLYLFQQLPPVERVAFLYWCCDTLGVVKVGATDVRVTLTNETGEAMESYLDFWSMVSQYELDAPKALAELERRVKQFTRPKGIERTESEERRILVP